MNASIAILLSVGLASGPLQLQRLSRQTTPSAPNVPATPTDGKVGDTRAPWQGMGYPIPAVAGDPLLPALRAMISRWNPRATAATADAMAQWIIYYSRAATVEPALVAGLIARESSFNPDAVSPTGARGLGQLTPATAKDMGVLDPFNPEENIRGTAACIARLLVLCKDRPDPVECALASYLVGWKTVQANDGILATEPVKGFVADVRVNARMLAESAPPSPKELSPK